VLMNDDNDDSSIWHEAAAALPSLTDSKDAAPLKVVETKTAVAERLLEAEAADYQRKLSRKDPADYQWLQTVRAPCCYTSQTRQRRCLAAREAAVSEYATLCN
jgi:hypothetical protein